MKLVVFGLSISSSWGNGHATLWRALQRALERRGWRVTFFEKDVSYYAANRDLSELPGGELVFYSDWDSVRQLARRHIAEADVAMVTSFCPDGIAATDAVADAPSALRVFYDLDTPVTLDRLRRGEALSYVGERGLRDFDIVLSFTGGRALEALRSQLGAKRVAPLYGHVDPMVHQPATRRACFAADLSYLGTYAADRQENLARLLLEPAHQRPQCRFLIAGAQYPQDFPWAKNIFFVRHLPPEDHSSFYSSSRLTLNVTRASMAAMGWCPSGRLFEAAACGVAILSDSWAGLDEFFVIGEEIHVVHCGDDVIARLDAGAAALARMAEAARARVLRDHTAERRAGQLETILHQATHPETSGKIATSMRGI